MQHLMYVSGWVYVLVSLNISLYDYIQRRTDKRENPLQIETWKTFLKTSIMGGYCRDVDDIMNNIYSIDDNPSPSLVKTLSVMILHLMINIYCIYILLLIYLETRGNTAPSLDTSNTFKYNSTKSG